MRITLIHPPDGMLPTVPYASMPTLTACLGAAGHQVTVRDVNLEILRPLLRRERLEGWYDLVEAHAARLSAQARLTDAERRELWRQQRLLAIPRSLFAEVDEALETFKTVERFIDPVRFNRAFDVLRSSQHFAMSIGPDSFTEPHSGPAAVLAIREHELPDPPVDLFKGIVEEIVASQPDLIAVTVPYDSSIFYALKLMKLLKLRAPRIPIALGGAGIDSSAYPVTRDPGYFAAFDYAMVGEGEEAFPHLLDVLEQGGDVRTVNNLRWLEPDGTIGATEMVMLTDLNVVPAPDFSNLPLDQYLLPDPVATFQTSRGCYYGKCTFCSEIFRKGFRMRRPELVVEDMVRIHEQTGIRHFQLWDSLAPPKTLKKVAQAVIARGLPFEWMAETKFEKPYLDERTIETLAKGGCTFLLFGFESGSSKVLDLIDKGNDLGDVERIVALLAKHGIRCGASWFIGFPGEDEIDADTTYDFIGSRRDRITFSNYTRVYDIGTDTIVYENQARFGIEVFDSPDGGLDFRYRDGGQHWDRKERDEAFHVRGDLHAIKNHVELHYAKVPVETVLQITGQGRMGPLFRNIDPEQIRDVRFQKTPECVLKHFERHAFRDEPGGFTVAYHTITGHVFELDDEAIRHLRVLEQPHTLAELVALTGDTEDELALRLELSVNRGLVRILCEPDQIRWLPQAERRAALVA